MSDAEEDVSAVLSRSRRDGLITITIRLPPRLEALPTLRTVAYCVRRVIGLLLLVKTYRASQKPSA